MALYNKLLGIEHVSFSDHLRYMLLYGIRFDICFGPLYIGSGNVVLNIANALQSASSVTMGNSDTACTLALDVAQSINNLSG